MIYNNNNPTSSIDRLVRSRQLGQQNYEELMMWLSHELSFLHQHNDSCLKCINDDSTIFITRISTALRFMFSLASCATHMISPPRNFDPLCFGVLAMHYVKVTYNVFCFIELVSQIN